jgi:hypothetical protein
MQSHARLNTDQAARYMTQLAKHWSHAFEVAFDAASARIPLPVGTCILLAEPDGLNVTVEASEMADLTQLEDVVAAHLMRFAFREPVGRLAWTRAWNAGYIDPPTFRVNRLGA